MPLLIHSKQYDVEFFEFQSNEQLFVNGSVTPKSGKTEVALLFNIASKCKNFTLIITPQSQSALTTFKLYYSSESNILLPSIINANVVVNLIKNQPNYLILSPKTGLVGIGLEIENGESSQTDFKAQIYCKN